MFAVAVGVPCFFVALWGSKMINDLGNNPSKSAKILASAGWKIFLVEIVSFILLTGVYMFLFNIQNG